MSTAAPRDASALAAALLPWFDLHGRKDLPWQSDPSPYRVWVSEIMLQQTQVATVIPYYQRFMARLPDVGALAAADLDTVLHLWSGLGYYARARNLHRCARIVRDDYAGDFPADIEALRALPGIGRSTAGAILALALGQRQPILDGNVKRVLTRYHAIGEWPGQAAIERRLWELAAAHTPAQRIRDYTQAIMDLGATVCTRTRPACADCPLAANCQAHAAADPGAYPVRRARREKPVRELAMLVLQDEQGSILLLRRPPTGIWGGLWSLPELPAELALADMRAWCRESLAVEAGEPRVEPPLRHEFTHFTLHMLPLRASARPLDGGIMEGDGRVWYNHARSGAYGMPAAIRRLLGSMPGRARAESFRSQT
ncbi:MAG: A/G-specific adenine glycosylase [Gammaproteobacteria bacterium]|nr:A/G-specific adenine glycosylase [Gammaproteobacteria bacterium]